MRIDIGISRKIDAKRKKGDDSSGIDIKIIGIARSSFIAGNEISNCQPFRIVSSVVVIIGMINQIGDSRTMIDVLMSRSGEGHQFTIGWGAGLACMIGLVNTSVIFLGIWKNMKK